jgi:ribosomal protein L21E
MYSGQTQIREGQLVNHQIGERVRVEIPDSSDLDRRYHGEVGTIVDITTDHLGEITGDLRDNRLYYVEFDDGSLGKMTFRHYDLEQEV